MDQYYRIIIENAVKRALLPFPGTNEKPVSTYVFDEKRNVFVRGTGDKEYLAVDAGNETEKIGPVCVSVKPHTLLKETIVVVFHSGSDDCVEFLICKDKIIRISSYGDCNAASQWIEKFVPEFSSGMGGTGRFSGQN